MTTDRRTGPPDRRAPAGSCTTCGHPQGDHYEGLVGCFAAGCDCQQFTVGRPVQTPAPKKTRVTKRPTAAKKK
jgi:hypothetical protein